MTSADLVPTSSRPRPFGTSCDLVPSSVSLDEGRGQRAQNQSTSSPHKTSPTSSPARDDHHPEKGITMTDTSSPHDDDGRAPADPLQSDRVARYAEAIHQSVCGYDDCSICIKYPEAEDAARAVVAVADEERAALVAEVERLRQWKTEATEVILGLQDVGKALRVPLGERITSRSVAEAAERMTARAESAESERDELRAEVERLRGEYRQLDDAFRRVVTNEGNHYDRYWQPPGKPLTSDWLDETKAKMREALTDAFCDDAAAVMLELIAEVERLRAKVAKVEALADESGHSDGCRTQYAFDARCNCWLSDLRAVLADAPAEQREITFLGQPGIVTSGGSPTSVGPTGAAEGDGRG